MLSQHLINVKVTYGNNYREKKCINKKNTSEWSMFVRIDYKN